MTTLLVTGASGFLGGHLVRAAIASGGLSVRALVRPTSDTSGLRDLDLELARGDVTDPAAVAAACAGVEAVIHAAGLIRARDEAGYARVNVFGARVVAEACAGAGVRRLVLVSSLAARGPRAAPGPVSLYGRSKLAGERAARAAAGGVELIAVRPTAIYGPRDQALLPFFRLAALGLRLLPRRGGVLTLVHAGDLAAALVALALAREAPPDEVLEASDGRTYGWEEVIAGVAFAVGRPGRARVVPAVLPRALARLADLAAPLSPMPPVFGRDKLADLLGDWPAEGAPLWRAAGRAPAFDLASGLADTVRSYRQLGWL